jgi:hypothetical protein
VQAIAKQYPQYASQITSAAKTSCEQGANSAYAAGIIAVLLGAVIVYFFFPRVERERALLAEYAHEGGAAQATA